MNTTEVSPDVVEVFWTDTTNVAGGWHDKDELEDFATNQRWECSNIGYLVYEDEECIVLAGRRTTDNNHTGLVERIPKKMIVGEVRYTASVASQPKPNKGLAKE